MNLEISLTKKSNLMESFMETDKILLILERRQAVSFFNYSNITIRNMRNNFKNTRNRLAHCNWNNMKHNSWMEAHYKMNRSIKNGKCKNNN